MSDIRIDRTWLTWGKSTQWSVRLDQIVSVKTGTSADGNGWLKVYALGDDEPWKINYSKVATERQQHATDHRRVVQAVDTVLHGDGKDEAKRQRAGIQRARDEIQPY